jgi:hypothetical protein
LQSCRRGSSSSRPQVRRPSTCIRCLHAGQPSSAGCNTGEGGAEQVRSELNEACDRLETAQVIHPVLSGSTQRRFVRASLRMNARRTIKSWSKARRCLWRH